MKNKKLGLYIHIPFRNEEVNHLQTHSYYGMGFYVEEYFEMLNKELELRNPIFYNIDSIYIGGGNPSCIPSKYLIKLLKNIIKKYTIGTNCEITIEINPDCEISRIADYISVGVNRFSIKVFPFNNEKWDSLKSKVTDKVKYIISKEINNINLDIYFAYKKQNINLDFILEMQVSHLSFYSLNDGDFDYLESKTLNEISEVMKNKDYIHYEINHYCKTGFESKYSAKYWNLDEYIGIGLGSSGFIDGLLYKNELEFESYFNKISENKIPYFEKEYLQDDEFEKIYIISKMGTKDGINLFVYKEKFDADFELKYAEILEKFISNNIIEKYLDNYRFTEEGMYLSNEFFMEIL